MYRHEVLNHGYDTLVRTHIRGFTGPSELEQGIMTQKSVIFIRFLLWLFFEWCGNDPSAGSPTETLLRLHLPLNDEV